MKENRVAFCHFGCRLNLFESVALESEFLANGFTKEKTQNANWIIVNTCAVTQRAEEKNRQAIRRLQRENPRAKIILTGCYASRDPSELSQMEGVHAVVENGQKAHLFSLVQNDLLHKNNSTCIKENNYFNFSYHQKPSQARAYLKIQDGCDRQCSYCQIPFSRGRGISRPLAEIKIELKNILSYGVKEIVLTGVNLGDYASIERRNSSSVRYGLFDLLEELASISVCEKESQHENNDWYFRLSSLEPDTIDKKIIPLYQSEKLAKFLHAPLQSGSDKILCYMKRDYTASLFKEKISMVHEGSPHIRVSSDVIVGFAGEDEDDFAQTQKIIQDSSISGLHVFPYSHRDGTSIEEIIRANNLSVPPALTAGARVRELYRLEEKLSAAYLQKTNGNIFRAIYQKKNRDEGSFLTENNFSLISQAVETSHSFSELNHGQMVHLQNNNSHWQLLLNLNKTN